MKLCWEATGGTPGSCVKGPLTKRLEENDLYIVRTTGHKTPEESSVILQIVVRVQLTFRRILRD